MAWYDSITSVAAENVGNWRKFANCIQWDEKDPKTQYLVYFDTGNQADHLEDSNRMVIERELRETDPDNVEFIKDSHWAVGWLNGAIITAIDENGEETAAWLKLIELAGALSDYPILDENDFSEREYNQLMDDIQTELDRNGYGFVSAYSLDTENFETGTYPDTDKVIALAIKQIETNIDDDSAEKLIQIVKDFEPPLFFEKIEKADIENRLGDMSRSDLEDLQRAINAQLKIR